MITENLSTLKIHKLTQAQYDRELEAGRIDEYALYLTPDEAVDLSEYATVEQLNTKADANHNHDDVYYTEIEIDTLLAGKADTTHNHDSSYDTKGSANSALASAKEYTNTKTSNLASTTVVDNKISSHNTSTSAHSDIRNLISGLTTNKVDKSDIANNLTTQVSNRPLSANQGVVLKGYIDDLQDELDTHTHAITDVSGLQSALDGKAAKSHGSHVVFSDIAPVMDGTASVGAAGYVARSDHRHPTDTSRAAQTDLVALEEVVSGKADATHTHAIADVSGLQAELDSKVSSEHTHNYAGKNVTGETFIVPDGNNAKNPEEEFGSGWDTMAENGAEIFNSYDKNIATGMYSHAEGRYTEALGSYSHAEGYNTRAEGESSHAEGNFTWAYGMASHAEGYRTYAQNYQHTSGKYNVTKNSPATENTQDSTNTDAIFMVGCGTSSATKNAFRITSGGKCFGASSFGASGADFAELFEWADSNPNNEDRRGLFVTLDGDKIKLANTGDDYIGVISGAQAFIGNSASEEWQGKYLTDVFGVKLSQEIEIPAEIDEMTGKVITPTITTTQYVLNPDYNPDEEYVMRENRKEWGIVGLLGQIVMIDDGTCVVGGRVAPSVNGVGTASNNGYRVMKRIDENHIKVLVK